MENVQEKVVWITGASSGLGKALATTRASQGAQIVLSARRFEELENVRASLPNPDQHIPLPWILLTKRKSVMHMRKY